MVSIEPNAVSDAQVQSDRTNILYKAAWRWHFYAGLYVIPFLIMLALTGLVMLWISVLSGRDGEWINVTPQEQVLPVSELSDAAVQSVPGSTLVQYVAPRGDDLVALFRVDLDGVATMVAVNPYTAEIMSSAVRREGWYDFANDIHGTVLLGVTGDRMIEIAASLTMVLIATGMYLWWPRNGEGFRALIPKFTARRRSLWKTLHATIGAWVSVLLVLFLLSGLAWAGIWGGKFVQAWSTFPAEKWGAPLSDVTHASMNHGATEEVPWALEQTPMPASGSDVGVTGLSEGQPVNIDTVTTFARQIGYDARFQLNLPSGETGVWTISRDSMSNDSANPTDDRTVHIDQYTGRILADVRFEDYSIYGQGMAVGIALHEGDMGIWNIIVNTVFCLMVIFLSVSGVVMWWMRRPSKAGRIAAPSMPRDMPLWQGAVLVGLAVSLAFPLAGLTLLAVLVLDFLVISRIPILRRMLS
ncbi:Uncharacterized iron-regulated membrane protein [Octadecabacter temperatus]|uniref:Uncharacterized protein n=1 Tax=Octadecabacter temperatus TaxID=1458307 RepID=A0A0K0Y9B4_9RHOB|nr:PepSY domain-containing protein [Octadecabacter temperatus]AKS47554.1 hypothetical protein OSB_30380 [Octadecabacter temperatus]SIO41340.1 Uncharacterized iron-regulated membrane protein [Octadecabacter temperatus]